MVGGCIVKLGLDVNDFGLAIIHHEFVVNWPGSNISNTCFQSTYTLQVARWFEDEVQLGIISVLCFIPGCKLMIPLRGVVQHKVQGSFDQTLRDSPLKKKSVRTWVLYGFIELPNRISKLVTFTGPEFQINYHSHCQINFS